MSEYLFGKGRVLIGNRTAGGNATKLRWAGDCDTFKVALSTEKKEIKEDKQPQMHVWERRYGSFERAFTLPRGVDPNMVKAEFHDGLLMIRVPNTAPIKGRKVEIGG